MIIKDLKDLKKLIAICRSTGIESIRFDGIEMHLGQEPIKYRKSKDSPKVTENVTLSKTYQSTANVPPDLHIPTDALTEEQLLFYSADNVNGGN